MNKLRIKNDNLREFLAEMLGTFTLTVSFIVKFFSIILEITSLRDCSNRIEL
jgi:hypothetical protein